jgi:hypothetical protein
LSWQLGILPRRHVRFQASTIWIDPAHLTLLFVELSTKKNSAAIRSVATPTLNLYMANLQSSQSSLLTGQAQCGVGLSLQCHNSRFYVAEVLPICSGFFEHSIQPGDEIQKVGSLDVRGLTLDQLDRAFLGEAGTFVSVLLQRHSQLLETTLLRIEQPRAASLKQILPSTNSPVSDDAEKIAQAIRGFDTDNAHLRTTLKSAQSQLSGACCVPLRNYTIC